MFDCTYTIYLVTVVHMAKAIVAFRHFLNAPKKAACAVNTSDRTLARVCEMLPCCCYYYGSRTGVEEEDIALRTGVSGSWRSEQQRRN